jgi:hypothetical protein
LRIWRTAGQGLRCGLVEGSHNFSEGGGFEEEDGMGEVREREEIVWKLRANISVALRWLNVGEREEV